MDQAPNEAAQTRDLNSDTGASLPPAASAEESLLDIVLTVVERWRLLVFGSLLAGVTALAATYAITPVFTARAALLPPQQQSGAASALASLGALAGAAGGAAALRTPADQYVALMQSVSVADALIDRFKLMQVYEAKYREESRRVLAENTRVSLNKRAAIITVEVDDTSPQRAAAIANAFVEELRRLTGTLAITEAQQRRAFFEAQMQQARERMTAAQQALQGSGFSDGVLRAEPRAAIEAYARLKAEARAAEVVLQALRTTLLDTAPEVRQQMVMLSAARTQLAEMQRANEGGPQSADYISKLREFKYHEALFELLARQFESAKVDEAREGALIQVIDAADVPERKSSPKRAITALATTAVTGMFLLAWILISRKLGRDSARPGRELPLQRLRNAFAGRRNGRQP